jgi:hypothetical protein
LPPVWYWLISAFGADNFQFFAIIYCDIIAETLMESDVMSAIEPEFFTFKSFVQNASQFVSALIKALFFFGHAAFSLK